VLVARLVEHREHLPGLDAVAALLERLALGGQRRRVADIRPAAGEGPLAASPLADEQELLATEDDRPHVHLRGRIAEARGKDHADLLGRDGERAGRHRHRDPPQLLVALAVEGTPA
jgi:hypothetical protein